MLSRLYAVTSEPNIFSAKRERLEAMTEQQKLEALRSINAVQLREAETGRKIEILSVQIGFLEDILKDPASFDVGRAQADYLERLRLLEADLIENQRVALKSRDGTFKEGKFIKLTEENQKELLEEFKRDLEKELIPHKQFSVVSPFGLQERITALRKEEAALKREFDQILEYKSQLQDESFYGAIEAGAQAQASLAAENKASHESEQNQLIAACKAGNLVKVKPLVEVKKAGKTRSAFINQQDDHGQSALLMAILFNHTPVVEFLLNNGADPNQTDKSGCAAIHYAAVGATYDTLELLQRHKANLLAKDNKGRTSLYLACFHANWGSIRWLLSQNVPIDAPAAKEYNRTPLHAAAFRDRTAVVRFLLSRGANARSLNVNQETPLFEAVYAGHLQTAMAFFNEGIWLSHKEQDKLLKDKVRGAFFREFLETLLEREQGRIKPVVEISEAEFAAAVAAASDSEPQAAMDERKHMDAERQDLGPALARAAAAYQELDGQHVAGRELRNADELAMGNQSFGVTALSQSLKGNVREEEFEQVFPHAHAPLPGGRRRSGSQT